MIKKIPRITRTQPELGKTTDQRRRTYEGLKVRKRDM